MNGQDKIRRDEDGMPANDSVASSYFPTRDDVIDMTARVQKDWTFAWTEQSRGRREFNDRSLLTEIDVSQMAFNSYVPPKSQDPDESWRAHTVRPVTRNKLISIAAHVTASILYPAVSAQDPNDDEDRAAAEVMADLIEWNIENSDYKRQFINAVVSALVSPAVIVKAEFAEVMRTVKELKADGTWTRKEVIDEILSGFQASVVPCRELLIANYFEPNIQKQRFLIRTQYVDYDEAFQIYGKRENFRHVRPGVYATFDPMTRSFYDIKDEELKGYLVNVCTYYSRFDDLEVTFVNGIIMDEPDQPNRRMDKMYPFAKSGYEPINDGLFFYYKSAANKLGSDQDIVDTLYNMILDGSFLALMPPAALYGSEEMSSSVWIPGAVTSFKDPNSRFEAIGPRSDLRAGMEAISMVEASMSESSQDSLRAGNSGGGGERTAREVVLLEKNASIQIGLFGKMVGFLVDDIGNLMVGDILQHMTVAQVSEISGEMSYKSFLIPDKVIDGKSVTKKIEFMNPASMPDMSTEESRMDASYDLLDKEGGPDSQKKIYQADPEIFRTRKYRCRVDVDELTPKSKALEKALNLEAYDRMIQNPMANQEAVYRDFLVGLYKPGDVDKYVASQQPAPQNPAGGMPQGGIQQKGVSTSMLSQITGSNSLGVAASTE